MSPTQDIITMVALLEDAYSLDALDEIRNDSIKRRSKKYLPPAAINYIARDRLKSKFRFELGTAGECRRWVCQFVRDVENITMFFLNIHRGNVSWLYYTLTA